jgi:tetratricopeptide (TPR) repeat protein
MASQVRTAGFGLLLTALLAAGSAAAQVKDPKSVEPGVRKDIPQAPEKLPKISADKTRGLDFLFGALKAAPDEASAKHVEGRIWAQWSQTSSDTAALLMTRAKTALDAKQIDVSVKLLSAVIKLKPDYIEGWNRRATLYYLQNDYTQPRHFGALAGLGMIMQEFGDDKRALEAYRKALAVNPHLEKVPELVKSLTEKVEGRDI